MFLSVRRSTSKSSHDDLVGCLRLTGALLLLIAVITLGGCFATFKGGDGSSITIGSPPNGEDTSKDKMSDETGNPLKEVHNAQPPKDQG
jgi:hypothetical protein